MSNELAIVAVTLTLHDMLSAYFTNEVTTPAVLNRNLDIEVTTLQPQKMGAPGASNQVNLFLYAASTNGAWRNQDMPTVRAGETGFPPLPLNLEYLISTFGEGDSELLAHFLLGHAMRLLHDNPIIPREQISLPESGLRQQIERVTVTQRPISVDEMSKLWSSFVAPYRPSAAYLVTVVLIESRQPARSALPVLRRGADDRGPTATTTPPPSITALHPPKPFVVARLGDDVVIEGKNLVGSDITARIRHPSLGAPVIAIPDPSGGGDRAVLHIGNDAAAVDTWIAGVTTISLLVDRSPLPAWITNELPLPIAPSITVTAATDPDNGQTTITVACSPVVRPGQNVLLLFGDTQIVPEPPPPPAGTPTELKFLVSAPAGSYVVRLRVDGVDSIPAIKDPVTGVLIFDPDQTVVIP